MQKNVKKVTEAQKRATSKYLEQFDDIKIRVKKGEKDTIKHIAEMNGESMNEFIKRSIYERSDIENIRKSYLRGLLHNLEDAYMALIRNDNETAKSMIERLIENTKSNIAC